MRHLISAMFLVAGIIHLIPITGVVGSAALTRLYGIPIEDPSLVVLMRHRAVMFALLGALLVGAIAALLLAAAALWWQRRA